MRFQQLQEGLGQDADHMEQDHEVQMARADCFHAAKNAIELHQILKNISERQGLEGWVSEKITLAADYLRTVKEYLEYETMPSDNAIILSTPNYGESFNQYMKENKEKETGRPEQKITTPGIDANARNMLIRGYGRHPESQNDIAVLANVAAELEDRGRVEISKLSREKDRLDRENRQQDKEINNLELAGDLEAREIARIRAELDSLEQRIAARRFQQPSVQA